MSIDDVLANNASVLDRIQAVGPECSTEPPADAEDVTSEAVTEAALNPEAGLQVPQQPMRFDPVLGTVPAELDEAAAQAWVADQAAQAAPEPVAGEPSAQELADALTEDALASEEGQAGIANWQAEQRRREAERRAAEDALDRMAELREFIASKLSLPEAKRDHYLDLLSVYVLHTYSFRASGLTPYIYVIARTRGAGKSQVGKLVYVLTKNPTKLLNPQIATPAVMADFYEEGAVTLFDETDKLTPGEAKETAAMLNLGNVKGGARYKMRGGKDRGRVEQGLFAPKVVMGIARSGSLPFPDDTLSRGITLEMETCTQDERRRIGRFSANFTDYRDLPEIVSLRDWMGMWSLLNDRAIRDDVPDLPDLQGFRGGEVVEPLVTLADLLGGDWPARIRAALVALDTDTPAPVDPTAAFFSNLRVVLETYQADRPEARFISVSDLFDAWKAVSEERLNSIAFGKRIGSYGLGSKVTKISGKSIRAYEVDALAELVK